MIVNLLHSVVLKYCISLYWKRAVNVERVSMRDSIPAVVQTVTASVTVWLRETRNGGGEWSGTFSHGGGEGRCRAFSYGGGE